MVVEGEQVGERFERSLIVGMPEPVELAQRRVGFGGAPAKVAVTVDDIPVVFRDDAGFVADPADVAVFEETGVGEYERVGLISAQLFDDVGEIVNVSGAAGAVEPEFGEFAVVKGEFVEFGGVIFVVFGGVAVAGS